MKNITTLLLLFFPLLLTAQAPISEAEARTLAERFLESLQFDQAPGRDERLVAFLDQEARTAFAGQEAHLIVPYHPALRIAAIEPPLIKVYASGPAGSRWKYELTLELIREEGRLCVKSKVQREWESTTISPWQASSPAGVDYSEEDLQYLEQTARQYARQHCPVEAAGWEESDLTGDWVQDRTVWRNQNGEISADSSGGVIEYIYRFLPENQYLVKAPPNFLGIKITQEPGTWFVERGCQVLRASFDSQFTIFAIEETGEDYFSGYLLYEGDTLETHYIRFDPNRREEKLPEEEPEPVDWEDIQGVEWIIPPEYDQLDYSPDGYLKAKYEEKSGVLDLQGRMIIPVQYEELTFFGVDGRAAAKMDEGWVWIDTLGQIRGALEVDEVNNFFTYPYFWIARNGRHALWDSLGNELFLTDYEMIMPLDKDLFEVYAGFDQGLVDRSGEEILEPLYSSIYVHDNGYAEVTREEKTGLFDAPGRRWILRPEYEYLNVHDQIVEVRQNGKIALYNLQGEQVEVPEHDVLKYFQSGYWGIERQGRRGVVKIDGREVVPIKYAEVEMIDDSLFAVKQDGKWGLFDVVNGEFLSPRFDEIHSSRSSFSSESDVPLIFALDQKKGLMDGRGNVLAPANYDYIGSFDPENGLLFVMVNEKYGCIDAAGQLVIQPQYDDLSFLMRDLIVVGNQGKYGAIDAKGAMVIPMVFDRLSGLSNMWTAQPEQAEGGLIAQIGRRQGLIKVAR